MFSSTTTHSSVRAPQHRMPNKAAPSGWRASCSVSPPSLSPSATAAPGHRVTSQRALRGARDAFQTFLAARGRVVQEQMERIREQDARLDAEVASDCGTRQRDTGVSRRSATGGLPSPTGRPARDATTTREAPKPAAQRERGGVELLLSAVWHPLGIVGDDDVRAARVVLGEWLSIQNTCDDSSVHDTSVAASRLLCRALHRAVFYCMDALSPDAAHNDKDGTEPRFWVPCRMLATPADNERGRIAGDEKPPIDSAISFRAWLFVLSALTEMGYRRTELYRQLPSNCSTVEAMLALLWVTRRYGLPAVARLVTIQERAPFLFSHQAGVPHDSHSASRETFTYPKGDAWPPWAWPPCAAPPQGYCRAEDDRRDQRSTHIMSLVTEAQASAAGVRDVSDHEVTPRSATQLARCFWELQHSIGRQLHRIESLLCRRAALLDAVGANHSPADLLLCLPDCAVAFEQVSDALRLWSSTERDARAVVRAMDDVMMQLHRIATSERSVPGILPHGHLEGTLQAIRDDAEAAAMRELPGRRHPVATQQQDKLTSILERYRRTQAYEFFRGKLRWLRRKYDMAAAGRARVVGQTVDPVASPALPVEVAVPLQVHHAMRDRYSLASCVDATTLTHRLSQQAKRDLPRGVARRSREALLSCNPALESYRIDVNSNASSSDVQTVFVGPPSEGRTTSVHVEMARLRDLVASLPKAVGEEETCALSRYRLVARVQRNSTGGSQ